MSLTKVSAGVLNIDDLYGFRNRIINGDMRIDQRNAGAAVTANASFPVDRWKVNDSQGLGFSSQRSTTAPAGYSNSLSYTVTGTGTVTGTNNVRFTCAIEGYNTADLAFGTASGKPVTVSFNVRSSLTGTFCVAVWDSSPSYSYVAEYTINSANTWETKSVTIPAPTSGTWNTDNSIGLILLFDLGSGPDRATTADTWQAGLYSKTSNQVQMHDTNGATFYITGVQLEVGSVATPFERRPFGTELSLCQRYFWVLASHQGTAASSTTARFNVSHPWMRATPSVAATSALRVTNEVASDFDQSSAAISITGTNTALGGRYSAGNFTGMTNYNPANLVANYGTIQFSSEL